MTLSEEQRSLFVELLAEGMHVGYRKAIDSYHAALIHGLIRGMPDREWGAYVDFVSRPLIAEIERVIAAIEGERDAAVTGVDRLIAKVEAKLDGAQTVDTLRLIVARDLRRVLGAATRTDAVLEGSKGDEN